jgi:hypothetical protein
MKAWLFLALILGFAACSEVPSSPYTGSNQPRVVATGASVTVVNVRGQDEAMPWAADYCAKRGRVAHFLQMETNRFHHKPTDSALFECVQG